jgi:predicted DNA-binding transcriptional regulator AlpA
VIERRLIKEQNIFIKRIKENNMQLEKYNDLLSVQDLMEIFQVSKQTIYKNIHEGKFGTPIQIGRAFKVPRTYIINTYFTNYK